MNARNTALFLLIAVFAATAGWWAGHRHGAPPSTAAASGRKILFYQSAMHPWIKSDRPGQCTICGMELSPVFEGDAGLSAGEGVIALGSNIIQVLHVQTDELRRGPLHRTLRVAGVIESDATRRRVVAAYVDGRIDRLAVNYVGAEVQAGQPLATLYSASLLAVEREFALLSRSARAQPSPERQTLLDASGQRLRRLGLTAEQIASLPAKGAEEIHSDLLAPLSGTVVERFAYEGQYVKEGDRLFDLADFSTMWFQFDAYERDLAWLEPGQSVEVTLPSVPGRSFHGQIAFIDPNLKDMTRSARVRVELANPIVEAGGRPRRELASQAYAEGAVRIEAPDVLLIPRTAVLSPGGNPVAYVDQGGGAYEQRRLRLGRRGDDTWEVLEGVAAGERVVIEGNLLIDAQAQLNSGSSGPAVPGEVMPATTPGAALGEAQQTTFHAALSWVDAVGAALAADGLDEFNREIARAAEAMGGLAEAFPEPTPHHAAAEALAAAARLSKAADLAGARQSFLPLSKAAVALLREVRVADSTFTAFKIFRCPMTKRAFPGAPPAAEWIQVSPPVRNPWFGAEMLDCGSEVK